ncbi:hypothetical protein GQR58_006327 [Nymphon striatum]|nr:hypothetical protein GQR58_006327 [Nymphon striatum]
MVKKRQLGWFGHVNKMDKERVAKTTHLAKPLGTQPRGRLLRPDLKLRYNLGDPKTSTVKKAVNFVLAPPSSHFSPLTVVMPLLRPDGHYYVSLPWKREILDNVPHNYDIAHSVAERVYSKLEKDDNGHPCSESSEALLHYSVSTHWLSPSNLACVQPSLLLWLPTSSHLSTRINLVFFCGYLQVNLRSLKRPQILEDRILQFKADGIEKLRLLIKGEICFYKFWQLLPMYIGTLKLQKVPIKYFWKL